MRNMSVIRSLHVFFDGLEFFVGEGRIGEVHADARGTCEDAAQVRKAEEAEFAVVVSHARLSDAAEGKIGVDDVADGIVYRDAARGRVLKDCVELAFVLPAEVERERLFRRTDEGKRFVEIIVGENGQDGAEDLLLHARGVRNVLRAEHGRGKKARCKVIFPAERDGIRIFFQDPDEAFHVTLVDDSAVVRIAADVLSVKATDGFAERLQEIVKNAPVDKDIVRSYAGLTRVHEFAPGDAFARDIQLG